MIYYNLLKIISGIKSIINREIYYNYKINNYIKRGLCVGKDVYVGENVFIDYYYPYLIEIHDHCRISAETQILAHDATIFRDLNVTRLGKVRILEGTFIGSRCIILPGCTIGPRAMVAAGSVVNRDVGEGQMVAGNPARVYGNYSDLITDYRSKISDIGIVEKNIQIKGEYPKEEILRYRNDILKILENDKLAFIKGHPRGESLKNKIFWWTKEHEWIS